MNVFVEALGLVAIAYATFAVVSFIEIKNKYQGSETPLEENKGTRRGVSLLQEQRDDEAFVENQRGKTGAQAPKKTKKKSRKRPSVPRACLSQIGCCPRRPLLAQAAF